MISQHSNWLGVSTTMFLGLPKRSDSRWQRSSGTVGLADHRPITKPICVTGLHLPIMFGSALWVIYGPSPFLVLLAGVALGSLSTVIENRGIAPSR